MRPLIFSALLLVVTPAQEPALAEGPDRAEALAAGISRAVAACRGLEWKSACKIGLYSVEQLRQDITARLDAEWPAERREAWSRGLKALGLLPPDYDVRAGILALMAEQIAGFYDPDRKELRMVDRRGGAPGDAPGAAGDRMIMAHELVHALQDQHFDLKSLPFDHPEDDDLVTAVTSLVEGDATFAMMAFEAGNAGPEATANLFASGRRVSAMVRLVGGMGLALMPGMKEFKSAPPILQEQLMFPYLGGLELVVALGGGVGGRGYRAVDEAFSHPPLSTEQVLHPEKASGQGRDHPEVLRLPELAPLLGEGSRRLGGNSLGELGTRILLTAAMKKKAASTSAAGWDGDRWEVWERPGRPDALVWLSTWDGPEDAEEFCAAIRVWLAGRHEGATPEAVDWAQSLHPRDGDLADALLRRGQDVLLAIGLPRAAIPAAAREVFLRTARDERRELPPRQSPR